jgi:hypothetical protein
LLQTLYTSAGGDPIPTDVPEGNAAAPSADQTTNANRPSEVQNKIQNLRRHLTQLLDGPVVLREILCSPIVATPIYE